MALVPHKITALAQNDADGTDGSNIVAGAVVSLYDTTGSAVFLYDDESGSNGSTAKQTDSSGQVVVWVTPGEYDEAVNGSTLRRISIFGNSATEVSTFAELELYRPYKTGQVFVCQERANAKYIVQAAGYTAQVGDVTFANGRVGALQIDGEANMLWFSGLSDAVDRVDGGGVVVIPRGEYTISPISKYGLSNVTIIGEGRDSTTLKLADNQNETLIFLSSPVNVTIEGLCIDGNDDNQGDVATYPYGEDAIHGVHFVDSENFTIKNCKIQNTRGCTIRGRIHSGTVIDGNYITHSGSRPIYLGGADESTEDQIGLDVINNTVDWSDQSFMSGGGSGGTTPALPILSYGAYGLISEFKRKNVRIIGNTFYQKNEGSSGDFVAHLGGGNTENVIISDNKLYGGGMGITTGKWGDGQIISNNIVDIPSASTISGGYAGIEVTLDAKNVTIDSNIIFCSEVLEYGIRTQSGLSNCTITGNIISSPADTGISIGDGDATGNENVSIVGGRIESGSDTCVEFNGCENFTLSGAVLHGDSPVSSVKITGSSTTGAISGNTATGDYTNFVIISTTSGETENISATGNSVALLTSDVNYFRDNTSGTATLGSGLKYIGNTNGQDILDLAGGIKRIVSSGAPGAFSAGVGSTFQRTDGSTGTSFYVKESGTGATGWSAK